MAEPGRDLTVRTPGTSRTGSRTQRRGCSTLDLSITGRVGVRLAVCTGTPLAVCTGELTNERSQFLTSVLRSFLPSPHANRRMA